MMQTTKAMLRPRLPYICAAGIFILSAAWAALTNQTWDDDAVGRFFNTQGAGGQPINFLDSWDRPLFVAIFFLPIRFFGRMGMSMTMSLLTALSGLLLYKGLEKKGTANAAVIVPFLLFQTFLFGISRDAMTEPLASFFICLGINLLYNQKYFLFAIVGSLLPLARPETIFMMPFWMIPLLKEKKYIHILALGAGTAFWWIGWTVFTGSPMAFFHEVFKTGSSTNRYGHTNVSHYIGKYIYVLGPPLFFFFVLGFITNVKKVLKDTFVILQFTVSFIIYILFSSFLDLGQSGGALRNLVTLSPFAAVIALYGYNYWLTLFTVPGKARTAVVKHGNKKEADILGDQGKLLFARILFTGFVIFFLIISFNSFTDKLLLRQGYDPDEKDYTVFLFLLASSFLCIFPLFSPKRFSGALLSCILALQLAFTLSYESPQSHSNSERDAMANMSAFIGTGSLRDAKVYCNHPWFFWSAGAIKSDSTRYGPIDSAHLLKMDPGSIAVWEAHYTKGNYGNIPLSRLANDTSFAAFYYVKDKDGQLWSMAFIKLYDDPKRDRQFFGSIIKEHLPDSHVFYLNGRFERLKEKDPLKAIHSYDAAIRLDGSYIDAFFERGIANLDLNDREKACDDLRTAAALGSREGYELSRQLCGNTFPKPIISH